jgi:hypothetical protein
MCWTLWLSLQLVRVVIITLIAIDRTITDEAKQLARAELRGVEVL